MSKPAAYVGCDPGMKGSWCLLIPSRNKIEFLSTVYPVAEVISHIVGIAAYADLKCIMLEDVHSLLGMSAKSNFSFGYNVGMVNTMALASRQTLDRVQPKVWQRETKVPRKTWKKGTAANIKKKALKEAVALRGIELYPYAREFLYGPKGGLLDGRSDSLLIAHYARLIYPT